MAERQDLSVEDFLSNVSKSDLKTLGLGDVAYLRHHVIRGHRIFVLHAADGSALTVRDNENLVREDAGSQGLDLITVH